MDPHEIERFIGILRSRNLDITAIQILGPGDVEPLKDLETAVAVDSETGEQVELSLSEEDREEYTYLLGEHNLRIRNYLADCAIPCVTVQSSENIQDIIIGKLAETGLLQ